MTRNEYRRDWGRRKRRLVAYGRWQPTPQLSPARARAHLEALRDTYGLSIRALAILTGEAEGVVVGLLYPNSKHWREWITPATEAAVLGARHDLSKLPGTYQVDSTGTHRRHQGLAYLGWSLVDLQEPLGMRWEAISKLRRAGKVAVSSALRVQRAYDQLSMTPGPSARTRANARRLGWQPPLAWDDIDDPKEVPTQLADGAGVVDEGDVAHLAGFGYDFKGVAERLGVTPEAVERALYRHERHDLLARLRRNRDGAARSPFHSSTGRAS